MAWPWLAWVWPRGGGGRLDPAVAYRKAAALLCPGGCLALVSTAHVLPERDEDPFFRQAQAVYAAVGLGDPRDFPPPPEAVSPPESAAIITSGHFQRPLTRRYLWSRRYTRRQYLQLLGTYSGHIAATDRQRKVLYARLSELIRAQPDGTVRKHYLNVLHVARRIG